MAREGVIRAEQNLMMKRLVCIILTCVIAIGIALSAKETVYLKNGSIISGTILEETPGESLKIRTGDGNVFVYPMDDIERIVRVAQSEPDGSCNIRHRKLDFSVATGVNIATKGGGTSIPVELTLSKRFSPYFSAGIGAGVQMSTDDFGSPIIPITANLRGFMPLHGTRLTPFADFRVGYAINTAEDEHLSFGSGKHKTSVDIVKPDYVTISIMPGVRFPLSHTTDLDLALGYEHYIPTKGGNSNGAFAIRAGFNFHSSTDPNRVPKQHIPNPIWDSGLEIGLEASGISEYGAALLLGYKWSPRLSFALGIGGSHMQTTLEGVSSTTYYSESDCSGEVVAEDIRDYDEDYDFYRLNVFLRGQYRLSDRKFSPIGSIDIGYTKAITDDTPYINNELYNDDKYEYKPNGIFIRPAVGVSLRMGSNSYLQLLAGYNFAPGIPKNAIKKNRSGSYYHNHYESYRIKADGASTSSFYLSLSYKHTFSLFSRH